MAAGSQEERTLEAALAGIPRVADAIAAMSSAGDVAKALEAVARSYCNTASALGYADGQAQGWAATVMVRLREELEQRKSAT